jgi:hypothetical protein
MSNRLPIQETERALIVHLPAWDGEAWLETDIAGMVGKRVHVEVGGTTYAGTVSFAAPAGDVDGDLMCSSQVEVHVSDWRSAR